MAEAIFQLAVPYQGQLQYLCLQNVFIVAESDPSSHML